MINAIQSSKPVFGKKPATPPMSESAMRLRISLRIAKRQRDFALVRKLEYIMRSNY